MTTEDYPAIITDDPDEARAAEAIVVGRGNWVGDGERPDHAGDRLDMRTQASAPDIAQVRMRNGNLQRRQNRWSSLIAVRLLIAP